MSSFVKAIGSLLVEGSPEAMVLKEGVKMVIGNGKRTRFGEDICLENVPMKMAFPRMYALATGKSGMVQEFGLWSRDRWCWNIPLKSYCLTGRRISGEVSNLPWLCYCKKTYSRLSCMDF
ncbi:hypothetical protein Dsin_006614 [Dipteronia sinensis]|uniref:Uncharacterized protein n=1 Tax=Dipteronia sinensis TaxID=43782 RepID=A0AAE0AZX6_9ROSI|nr:hypothetical protein Dsin_006614 [Dipteronia sinensis]